jgi:hypothetical protein
LVSPSYRKDCRKFFERGHPVADEAEHFIRCTACGGWMNCRDLCQVFEHEGPLSHSAQDQPQ